MNMLDVAVIGSGIGGTLFAALNHKQHKLLLFEKDHNLGGCCSTFERYKGYYNTGATTFVGYEEGHVVKKIFDAIGYTPQLTSSPIGIRISQGEKTTDRVQNFDAFLDSINANYPNPNNESFWRTIKAIDEQFWQLKHLYYAKGSWQAYAKSLRCVLELLNLYRGQLFMSADAFIAQTLGEISQEYRAFINAQLLITLQTTSCQLSLLTMALGLAYTFHPTYYVSGGMGRLIEEILAEVSHKKNEAITKIVRHNDHYELHSTKAIYRAKNVVLNTTIYQSAKLFEDQAIENYYSRFKFSDQSAFVVYMKINSKEPFLHHYQIILKEQIPHTISHAFFVSFSDLDDEKLSQGGYSVTISTHTQASIWRGLSKEAYRTKKMALQRNITEAFLNYFDTIQQEKITRVFSATANTFNHYIGRYNCGGEALKLKNILKVPACTTPFRGLYHIGDTVFAGQGWPGVALGVEVLHKEFNRG